MWEHTLVNVDYQSNISNNEIPKYTVQIIAEGLVGAGVIVSKGGLILTCQHIIENVKDDKNTVEVYFPMSNVTKEATIFKKTDKYIDIALLQIQDKGWLSKQTDITVAPLSLEVQRGNTFYSHGFRENELFPKGLDAYGHIGITTPEKVGGNGSHIVEVITIYSSNMKEGMSGAPVFDTKTKRVIGIIREVFRNPEYEIEDVDHNFLALAIPIEAVVRVYPELEQMNPGLKILEFMRKINQQSDPWIKKILDIFVPPPNYNNIKRFLRKNKIVLLTGPPAYGKTFTAIRLLWEYHSQGYEPIILQNKDIQKFISVQYELGKSHIICFDDLFGVEKYEGNDVLRESYRGNHK